MTTFCAQCLWAAKGIKATNGNYITQFRANANMPHTSPYTGGDCYDSGKICTFYGTSQSYDLATFCRGHEVLQGLAMYRYTVCDSATDCLNGRYCHCLQWVHCDGCVLWTSNAINCIDIPAPGVGFWTWQYHQWWLQIGANAWEMNVDGNHCIRSCVTCYSGDDLGTGCISCLTPTGNNPTAVSAGCRGSIWIEDNCLFYRPEQTTEDFEQYIVGTCLGNVTSTYAGSMWIDTTHYLHWVGSTGNHYCVPWRLCQFCSVFGNSAGNNPAPGAGYAGAIWADGEFGYSHLAYIGCDGNKYIVGGGNWPYSAP